MAKKLLGSTVTQTNIRFAVLCAIAALCAGFIMVMFAVSPYNGDVSALVRMDPADEMAPEARHIDPHFTFISNGHYDGVYAYAIAMDPWATGRFHKKVDYPAYRYGRVGYGWLARLFSFGKPEWVPEALVGLNLAGLAIAGYGVSRLAVRFGWPPASGLIVAFSPGLMIGTTVDTSEPIALAIVVLALLAWFREELWEAAVLMAFACLIKEPYIAVPIGLLIWEFITRGFSAWKTRRTAVILLVASLLPLVGWWTYVHKVFHQWPFAQSWLVEKPTYGFLDTAARAANMAGQGGDVSQIGIASLAFVVVVGLAFVVALVHSLRLRTPVDAIFIVMVGIASILSWWQLLYAKELFRILAVPMVLLPAVFIGAPTRWRSSS